MSEITHIVAVDGGGTSCRVRLCRMDGQIIAQAKGGPANINTSFEQALSNIRETSARAYAEAGYGSLEFKDSVAYLGLAGVNVSNRGSELERVLGAGRCRVVSDLYTTVQGALGDDDGLVALFGTGSLFASRAAGDFRHIGGWGFDIGDLGSGAWVGREALRLSLRAYDGMCAKSDFSDALLAQFGGPAGCAAFAHDASPHDFGKLAPQVLSAARAQDSIGSAIYEAIVAEIRIARDALEMQSAPLCIVGGLGELIKSMLPDDLAASVVPAKGEPLDGAVALAQRFAREVSAGGSCE